MDEFSDGKAIFLKPDSRKRTMASWLIATIGVVYLVVAGDLFVKGQTGLGIAFLGYALGNVGLYMEAA